MHAARVRLIAASAALVAGSLGTAVALRPDPVRTDVETAAAGPTTTTTLPALEPRSSTSAPSTTPPAPSSSTTAAPATTVAAGRSTTTTTTAAPAVGTLPAPGLWVAPLDGGTPRRLVDLAAGWPVALSGDGRVAAYARGDATVRILDVATGAERVAYVLPGKVRGLALDGEGAGLAVTTAAAPADEVLVLVTATGASSRLDAAAPGSQLAWSVKGCLAFVRAATDGTPAGPATWCRSGQPERVALAQPSQLPGVAWAPEGDRLVVGDPADQRRSLVVTPAGQLLAAVPVNGGRVAWTSSGDQVCGVGGTAASPVASCTPAAGSPTARLDAGARHVGAARTAGHLAITAPSAGVMAVLVRPTPASPSTPLVRGSRRAAPTAALLPDDAAFALVLAPA